MTQKSSAQKSTQTNAQEAARASGAGPEGGAIAPPAYGIAFLDSVIQGKAGSSPRQVAPGITPSNPTGLPNPLKSGVEALSGLSLDDVRVHYNSPSPARLQALAFTQGTDIHLGPGQERHLPHEAWHVVQQAQGRVKPTLRMAGSALNNDSGLEREADVMGSKALASPGLAPGRSLSEPGQFSQTLQRRAVSEQEIKGAREAGVTTIFDSRVSYGKVFEAVVEVQNHDALTILEAYQRAITPIGNTFAGVNYTDVGAAKFPNQVPAMPLAPPANIITYLTTQVLGPGTVQFWLDVNTLGGMTKLFGGLGWQDTKDQLNTWFNTRDRLLDNKAIGLVDPFVVRLVFRSRTRGQQDWAIDTQFADSATGYITRILDGKHNITGQIVTNGVFNLVPAPAPGDAHDYRYSSTHVPAPAGAAPLSTRIAGLRGHQAGDPRNAQHDAFDAFTVLGAEGARFRPVSELGGAATLTANFFTRPKHGWAGARSVTLDWLYINWGAQFGRRYDITREEMAPVISALGPAFAITHEPARPNYNLINGVMHKN